MSDDPNVSAVWRDARGSLDVLFEHTCCYDREEFNAVIESVRADERERIARNIEALPLRDDDSESARWARRSAARIAREGA